MLLEEAVHIMLARRVSRLPVVDRETPSRMVGLLEWKGLARAWQRATEEEHIRESTTATWRTPAPRAPQGATRVSAFANEAVGGRP